MVKEVARTDISLRKFGRRCLEIPNKLSCWSAVYVWDVEKMAMMDGGKSLIPKRGVLEN